MMRREIRAARRAVLVLAVAALAAGAGPALCDEASDDRIRERILVRLVGQVSLHPESLEVEVLDGAVHLSGSVASVGERENMERLIGGIVGVKSIANDLTIRRLERSELATSQEVRRLLERRTRFRENPIHVTVAGTEVTLRGEVERALDRWDAEQVAANVSGVTRVINLLHIRTEGSVPSETIRERASSILRNPLTFGVIRDLEVEVDHGTVILRGIALRDADRLEAERLVLSVAGVTGVVNRISVLGS